MLARYFKMCRDLMLVC